jgi:uncharacterized protein (DUF1330 family)
LRIERICRRAAAKVAGFETYSQECEGDSEIMKTNHKLMLAVLVGAAIGAAGAAAIHAQQGKVLPGYVVAEVDVTDPATFKQYADKAPGTIAASNGHYIIRGGKSVSIEGEPPKRFVVIQFDSVEKAKAWEDSPAYEAIKPIRHSSAKSRVFIIEGAVPQ